ncbi:MAG: M20/M25/M40 family metallo-hydrolase, partial [Candidatus Hodarchaeales archaeon]
PNEKIDTNPFVFGKLGQDPNKKTILFYSHYDVQPAEIADGWDTDPFALIQKEDGYIYGRGTDDDKGPIAATIFAIKELLEENADLPVNIRILYEGEEESSSGGFEETVLKHKDFFGKVDGIMILDTSWFTDKQPSLDYGFRGITYLGVEIEGPSSDQHSGMVGGTIREPLIDLIYLMSRFVDLEGKVKVDGFYDKVKPLTEEEAQLYENLDFSLQEYKDSIGISKVLNEDSTTTLMNMWRNPCLSIHGIEGAFSGSGGKTVVPGKVIGKISMRLVPDQEPEEITNLFTKFAQAEFEKLHSPNKLTISPLGSGDWWLGDVNNFLFSAGKIALKQYWKVDPSFARSGGSIPIVPFLEKTFSAPAIGIGVGQPSDGAHGQNERIRIKNLVGGKDVIKLMLKNFDDKT